MSVRQHGFTDPVAFRFRGMVQQPYYTPNVRRAQCAALMSRLRLLLVSLWAAGFLEIS